jgi:hypothetical protein
MSAEPRAQVPVQERLQPANVFPIVSNEEVSIGWIHPDVRARRYQQRAQARPERTRREAAQVRPQPRALQDVIHTR